MPTGNDAEAPSSSKKVRLACRRCRAKRVKCDGGIPACGHCMRAGVPCVDVDGRNADLSIPRDYVTRCLSRIRWLEESIQLLDPSFDLSQGPSIEPFSENSSLPINGPITNTFGKANRVSHSGSFSPMAQKDYTRESPHRKRSYACLQASDQEEVPSIEAGSVATDLGMISLQSDSRQQSYLGSSSGVLFTKLIGAKSSPSVQNHTAIPKLTPSKTRLPGAKYCEEKHRVLFNQLSKDLPEPQEAKTLFVVYFREIHNEYPFLDPASLINAYNALLSCVNRGYTNETDRNGWIEGIAPFAYNGKLDKIGGQTLTPIDFFTAIFHVFMVFALSATLLTRNGNFDFSPTRFYKVALSAAVEGFWTISLSGLQSTLLLIMHGMIGPADFNIWTLSHIAVSHCIDLGLHREPKATTGGSLTALYLRRFIFYTVYKLDRTITTIQGRPLGIRDETFDIQLPDPSKVRLDSVSVAGDPEKTCLYPQRPNDLKITVHQFKLDRLVSEIKLLFYHLYVNDRVFNFSRDHTENQARLRADLDSWMVETREICSLPDNDDPTIGEDTRSICERLRMELLYHAALTLLHQPSQSIPHPSQSSLHICYESSRKRIQIYNQLNDEQCIFFSWRDIHGIFASGATIIFCFWSSPEIQSMTPLAEALQDLRTCSNLLSVGGQWWPSVRGGKESFDKLVDLTIKRLSMLQYNNGISDPSRLRGPAQYSQGIVPCPESTAAVGMGQGPPCQTDRRSAGHTDSINAEFETMDTLMDSFFSDYLQGDWSWDPFSAFPST